MLDFVIFAVTFAIALIVLVFYLYPARVQSTTIPGMAQSDPTEGNFSDIQLAGGITEFLEKLHDEYGEIASFWMGSNMVISLSSPEYFEQHKHASDRPQELLMLYQTLLGENSMVFSTGQLSRKRRNVMNQCLNCLNENEVTKSELSKLCKELGNKWNTVGSGEHIPLWQYMKAFSLKCSTQVLFGAETFRNDKEVIEFSKYLDTCYSELEHQLVEITTEESRLRKERFDSAKLKVMNKIRKLIQERRSSKEENSSDFVNTMINSDSSDDMIFDDLITCLFYYYSISSLLTWALYFISTHSEVQEKTRSEISKGDEESENYLSMVMKETLRMAPVFTWTARKQADLDTEIGGHIIPKDTPIIHAIGVAMMSEKYWTMPKLFNPDRFSEETSLHSYAPFGFAGNRKCPAEKFVSQKFNIFIREICSRFILESVDDQVIVPSYGIITKPAEEVWITLKKYST